MASHQLDKTFDVNLIFTNKDSEYFADSNNFQLLEKFQNTLNTSFRSHSDRSYQLECELLRILEKDDLKIRHYPEYLKNSFELADSYRSVTLRLIQLCPDADEPIQYLSERWKKDKELIKLALSKKSSQFMDLDSELQKDREIVLAALKCDIKYGSLFYKHDVKVVMPEILKHFANDFEILKECCLRDSDCFRYLSEEWRDNEELATSCFSKPCKFDLENYLSDRLKDNRQFISMALEKNPEIVDDCPIADDELILKALKHGLSLSSLNGKPILTRQVALEFAGTNYWYQIPTEFAKDKEICLLIVNRDGSMLDRLDKEIQNDMEVVIAAVRQHPYEFGKLSDEMKEKFVKSNREVIIDIVKNHSNYHSWRLFKDYMGEDIDFYSNALSRAFDCQAPESLYQEREFILKCLQNNVKIWRSEFPLEWKRDSEIIDAYWNAYSKFPQSFDWEIFIQDSNMLLEAIKKWDFNEEAKIEVHQFSNASKEILSNREIILLAAKYKLLSDISIISDNLKVDKEIVMHMLKKNPKQLMNTPLKNDKDFLIEFLLEKPKIDLNSLWELINPLGEFIKKVIATNGLFLEFANDSLKQDFDTVLKAVKQNGFALQFASPELQSNRELVLEAMKFGYFGLDKQIDDVDFNDTELLLNYASVRNRAIPQIPEEFSNDWKLMEKLLSINGDFLEVAGASIRNDEHMVLLAVKNGSWDCLQNASEERQEDLLTILRARQLAIREFRHIEMECDDWAPYKPENRKLVNNIWFNILSEDFETRRHAQYLADCKKLNREPYQSYDDEDDY